MKIHLWEVQNSPGKSLHFTSRFIQRDHDTAHKGTIVSGIKSPFELSSLATINGGIKVSSWEKNNQLANTVLKDQVMEKQSKCGHPHNPLVSLRMLEVKSPGEKCSPNTGTSLIIHYERQPSQGLGVLTGAVGISQAFDPDFSSTQLLTVQGHLNSSVLTQLPVQSLHFLFHRCTEPTQIILSPLSYIALGYSESIYLPLILQAPSHLQQACQWKSTTQWRWQGLFLPPAKGWISILQSSSD